MHTILKVDAGMKRKLEPLFADHRRVDFGIDSVLEGQCGRNIKVVVDALETPNVALLRYGTFGVLAGDAKHSAAEELLRSMEAPCAIQPSPAPWLSLLEKVHAGKIKKYERFSFSHHKIDVEQLKELVAKHPSGKAVSAVDKATAHGMEQHEWNKYHLMNYQSPEDFAENGCAYAIKMKNEVASACSAALRCSKGIELNIITIPEWRNQGLASVVAAYSIVQSLKQNLVPHWDAANERSAKLAVRLGYEPAGSYHTHYVSV